MSANGDALRMMKGREPVELGEGVTPERVVALALDVVDLGYRAHGENGRASLPAVQVDWMMQQWAEAEAAAERDGSDYADAMNARMEDAIAMERIGAALAVFARMDAMAPPEGVRLNGWLPAITAARAALKEAGLQRLMDPASGTADSEARRRT